LTVSGVDLPTNPKVQSEVGSHTPAVLGIAEYSLLRLLRIGGSTHITSDIGGVTQQEGGKAQTTGGGQGRIFRIIGGEGQLPGAVAIARHAQVSSIAQIDAELDGVAPDDLVVAFGTTAPV
jgi:hypothetical protein